MPKLSLVILTPFLLSCNGNHTLVAKHNTADANETATDSSKTIQQNGTVSWIDNFRKLRTAIYQGDKATVKTFIDFPIMNENDEIWDLVFLGQEYLIVKSPNSLKPFSEQDFDKYFNKIFTKRFVNSILKIKTADLVKNGHYETIEFSEGKSTSYHMTATYYKSIKRLDLNLASKTFYEDDDDGEFNINYQFQVLENGQIKFLQVRLAG